MSIEFVLINRSDMACIVPLLMELDPHIPKATIESRLALMVEQGYECVGIYDAGELIGICGIWVLVKYYVGRHLEPDNVYLRAAYQGQGIGAALQSWLEALAKSRDCDALELNCYVANTSGCEFWESVGYKRLGVHYQKILRVAT